jgi:predicted nucleic acid-binding protein
MSGWVLDASAALALGLPDERSPAADGLLEVLEAGGEVRVPALWWYEVANALAAARRRGRISAADHARLLELYRTLPVKTDALFADRAFSESSRTAAAAGLSAYDAAYLELAARRGLGLVTLDARLSAAAADLGVTVWKGRRRRR